ncbi:hypothetical protein GPJ56_008346 [Histomonas meleagridis]|uniref:uncharacterized protein n=1 Tax=Histomonas meleagridis TaxID=135588 RepID=UPI00355A9688|nr:hypothetical protein GPJ56_008346 [Histomonas meleagridis]KAH0798882.1 hypothetical protein GO595_008273 [Histomonas meleagridis]
MSPLEEDKENKEEDKVINLDYTYIASISQILDISGLKKIGSDEDNGQNELESFNYDGLDVSRSLVVDRIRGACETIDQICDAVTTKMVLTILRVCIVASMACAGWFFGGIISQAKFEPLYC